MKVKEESGKSWLKIQHSKKTKITASIPLYSTNSSLSNSHYRASRVMVLKEWSPNLEID